ncbi:MAG: hypothetical protein ACXWC7_20155, partial [Chitinophagaceae bacterium]
MMKLIVVLWLFALSCTGEGNNNLTSSDSLAIQFKSLQSGNVTKTVSTRDETAIRKLAAFVNGDADKAYKCGYDGTLSFYKKGMLVTHASFNYSQEGCRHFLQTQGEA